ncbi:hypothetical protein BDY21DRAFT_48093 [Lineolata rhizophorae]|uniref:Uncharacterized protein n=1 Tax=Lineolata rhizophorae TaxID=578093 RepID=A0A6A6NX03_9PEZI|nr:hypothetical protein BDY21DRAFT_48093 [Lineolata rhizophorae]
MMVQLMVPQSGGPNRNSLERQRGRCRQARPPIMIWTFRSVKRQKTEFRARDSNANRERFPPDRLELGRSFRGRTTTGMDGKEIERNKGYDGGGTGHLPRKGINQLLQPSRSRSVLGDHMIPKNNIVTGKWLGRECPPQSRHWLGPVAKGGGGVCGGADGSEVDSSKEVTKRNWSERRREPDT